jgi:hypothetical protein
MIRTTLIALALMLSTATVHAQSRSGYRDFAFGSDFASISDKVHAEVADSRIIHERPALMRVLEWRPSYFETGSNEVRQDTVQLIVFSFYNDQLYKMAIDYDRQRTEGMTDADMIAALSGMYGETSKPTTKRLQAGTQEPPIAQWQDEEYSVALYRVAFRRGFQAVVTSTRLDALAKTASAQAIRLDELEAPQRELARQKQAAADARVSDEKARVTNKAAFRP